MLTFDRLYQTIDGKSVEVSLADWMESSGLLVTGYHGVYSVSENVPSGTVLDIPEGMYNPARDMLIINQEGFILMPGFQYSEENGQVTLLIDIPANTNIHTMIVKAHRNISDEVGS